MASAPPPPVQNQAGMRKPRSASAPSIISSDLVVTGTLRSSGDVQIDGRVDGDVQSSSLMIGEKATIKGDVMAEEVVVRGHIEGSIRARKVLLASTCRVQGNILHEAFAVETGAFFEGNCRHADNPLGDDFGKVLQAAAPVTSVAPVAPVAPVASIAAAPHTATAAMTVRPMTSAAPSATFTPLKSN